MKKYHTDNVTEIFCNYYNGDIEEEKAIRLLRNQKKEDLIDYLLDSFNRGNLIHNIEKIAQMD